VSLLTRKRTVGTIPSDVRKRARDVADRAVPIAKQAVPIAKQAVPKAKQAGIAARQGAEDAVAWAAPKVDEARSWAAPRIERTGIAVRDTIAPKISDALVTAAHKVDTTPSKRRRWPKLLVGFAVLAAMAGVAAAIARRNRTDPFAAEPPSPAADIPAPDATGEQDGRHAEANGSQSAEANAQSRTS
jgi:hypothetical protein